MKKRLLAIAMTLAMTLSLLPVTALAAEPTPADKAPTASGTNFFANGTPITIMAAKPEGGEKTTIPDLTTGTSAYISWVEDGTTKYVGVSSSTSVYGGADGSSGPVSVASTSITMTGGRVWNVFGGNLGRQAKDAESCSQVTGDVVMKFSGEAVVPNLLHGGGQYNTCVKGTVYMDFNSCTALNDRPNNVWPYINGGVHDNGSSGTRDIANGQMVTNAVVNRVVITATNSNLYLVGGGGSGSTKVRSSSVTLNNCTLSSLYLGGINGEVEDSSIVATGCTIKDFSATNRGFVGTASVELKECKITEKLNFGAANGCFETDSGTPDGSGITGSSEWNIDAKTTVAAAALTPLAMRGENDVVTATFDNLTIEKAGNPLPVSVNEFSPRSGVTVKDFMVPEGSTLTLKNVQATVEARQTLTNVGTINMDEASKLSVASGATFGQLGMVNGGEVVINEGGFYNDDYVARIGTTGYTSLQGAVDAVDTPEPTTITLLKDASGDGVIVPSDKNMTFDLNNCTYTIDGTTVGSTGTETNGFQLLKDSTVTFKNGTITSDKAKILIQNYSNLTLDNVILNGTNLKGSAPYTLSNNFGNTRIKDTAILAATNGYAFDLYYWPSGGYEEGVSVTVEGNSVIDGDVQYGSDDSKTDEVAKKATLAITSGTFTGTFSTYGLNASKETGINITGGTFSKDVSDYVQPGMKQDSGGKIVIDTDTAVAEINGVGYISLDAALAAAKDGDTVRLLADATLSSEIKSGVTLVVPADKTLTVEESNYTTLFQSAGTIRVQNGGKIVVDTTKMIGGSDANINLTGGIDLKVDGSALALSFVGATAEIPTNHRWTLLLADKYPMNVTLDAATTLTVTSTGDGKENDGFRVAKGSTLTNSGTVIVNGVMTISSTGKVEGNGKIQVSGVLLNVNTAAPGNTITLTSGGKVYSNAGLTLNNTRELTDKTYDGVTYTNAWEYYVPSSSSGGSTRYTVTAPTDVANGSVKVSPTRASRGQTVTITVTPDEGYELASLAVYDADGDAVSLTDAGNGKYTFTMPRSKVTVEAAFAETEHVCPAGDFADVSQSAWYHAAVDYVLEQGIMSGVSADRFGPEDTLTRAMAAQMLWALEGKPVVNYLMQYGDVAQGAWYAEAVRWASAQGVMSGYSGETFGPEDNITREQLALILFNYADQAGYDVDGRADLSGYADEAAVSGWAVTALEWAVDAGLISGREGSALAPAATATRAEVAQIFMNFLENVAG